jgi:UDPglucose 6-dehydrogenase
MKITVFGTGYVGLVTGACLADAGHEVVCVDVDEEKIEGLNNGHIPIFEPNLEVIVRENFRAGRLKFTTNSKEAVKFGELQFIAVGTPPDEDGSADLRYVLAVARTIAEEMDAPKIIVDKSTVPVGTADKVYETVKEVLVNRQCDISFEVCSNPEFLKEGSAIEDFTKGSRIVVGTESEWVKASMRECYAPYSSNNGKLMFMDVRSAELTKYAANAMLATKISFINELSNIAERLGADIENVRKGIGSDPRIGYHFISPGCGYGGSCFPKDVQALVRTASEVGYGMELLKAVESVNFRQRELLFTKLQAVFNGDLEGCTIAVWGLSFKPNTDDMREAPSRTLMESLWSSGARVQAYDPVAMDETRRIYGDRKDLILLSNKEEAILGADALVICTEWASFQEVDLGWLKTELTQPIVIDGRNLFGLKEMSESGLSYYAVGRGDALPKLRSLDTCL